jgi:hypothetical protein
MGDMTPAPVAMNPYFTTDDNREAVGALEGATFFLARAEPDPAMWRWVITALHGAVQGFMVITLKGSSSLGAYDQESIDRRLTARQALNEAKAKSDDAGADVAEQEMLFGRVRLASFPTLYERIKTDDWPMSQYGHSKVYEPRPTDDCCMRDLNNNVRNDFIHFKPMTVGMLLTRFPAMTETGLHIITFLLNESNNILWAEGSDRFGLRARSETALDRAYDALDRINAKYADLPRPMPPLCGSEPQTHLRYPWHQSEGRTMQIDSGHEAFARVRAALIEAARDRRLLSYQDVADIMGYSGKGVEMGRRVGAMGDAINKFEHDEGRPMLSALIVKSGTRMPGEGFYIGAIELGRVPNFPYDASRPAFWDSERDAVYAEWGS